MFSQFFETGRAWSFRERSATDRPAIQEQAPGSDERGTKESRMRGHRGRLLAGDELLFERVTVFLQQAVGGAGHQITVTIPWQRVSALRRVNQIIIAGCRACDIELQGIENDAVKNETVGTFVTRHDPLERPRD